MGAVADWRRVRRLGRYLVRDRRRLLVALLLLLPLAFAGALQPVLLGQAVSVLRGEPSLPFLSGMSLSASIRVIIGLYFVSVLLRLGLQGVQQFSILAVGQRLTARIRDDLFEHALSLSLRFHDRMPVGKLLTRLTSDVDALAEVFGSGAVGVLNDLVSLLVLASTMLFIEWRLGLLLLFTQVPVTLAVLWLQRRYRKANYRVREELSQLNADFQENLQGLEVVQMYGRETVNSARFLRTGMHYRSAVNGTIFFDSSISAFLEWVALAAIALVLALGGLMVTNGAMGLGTLTTFILASQRLFDPLRQLAERFTQIQGGLTAVERIGELMEEPLEIAEAKGVLPHVSGGGGEVIFENVSFAYRPDDPILRNLSFRIAPGEHVALVGPTGSGKSTIIRLLCRLYEPQQGRILLDGRDIRTIPMADLRRELGVVLQDTFLFSGNVADNLRLNASVSDRELAQVCAELGLNELLAKLPNGLETELRERGGNLSSGERQLLAVARVAIRKPTVLVMDEATAFMDPSTEATLQADLDRLLQKRTAIVIAHRLATVEASDRILVLRRGELIEQGTHRELRARGGLYAQLADLQERGLARL
ncbi:MAG: ABC transporter ATP-binding protein [Synechococcus sp.]|jgi:ATP-binding cassette subfamily B multidrug efflux pump|uniref:ABC transporter ATP-binding protein n=1 Tax=unclassified Synechococcus TaxID=2626047 RepID=UPI000AEDCBEF|nr:MULTISPECIES: ABC transporter ATP-binding protein [unclassified Synechococcus]MCY3847869.1 ABC transporter ATP-binding protein [Cyanobacteria bacterium MAG COS4_bin_21]MCY4084518.1 ABC transporter ATP-binding protein [Cyanobacteria bacterium MAG COS1_bin_9]GIR24891.1 MAG: long-chain-fatty-acid--CoA ligase [Synechococcus sp.]QNI63947.1 putative ABC multidrug efflux transporter [Synechococcus sp. A15-44]QNI81846.1 putative ABC multidrug efflux transporter [Synechococcus sp. RS9907]